MVYKKFAFDALGDVATITEAQGQVIYYDGSDWNALAVGAAGQMLKCGGAGANPSWTDPDMLNGSTGGDTLSAVDTTVEFGILNGTDDMTATEENVEIIMPHAATINNLYVNVTAAPGVGDTWTFTVRKNGADQTLTCDIAGDADTTCSDVSNSFTVAAGDRVCMEVTTAGATATAKAKWAVGVKV